MGVGSLAVIGVTSEGSAISMDILTEWISNVEKCLLAIGETYLKDNYTTATRRKRKAEERLSLSVGIVRKSGAYGVKLLLGKDLLALSDLNEYQEKVLTRFCELIEGVPGKVTQDKKILKGLGKLKPDGLEIGEIALFWKGGGVILGS